MITAFFLSSCAIHFKFPFICFRKECILGVFDLSGGRKEAGGKRGFKQKAGMFISKFNKKRKRKNSKKQRERDNKEVLRAEKDTLPEKPEITYAPGSSSGICRELKIIILKKNNTSDTLLVYYPEHTKRLTEEKKKELQNYVEKLGIGEIEEVQISNCHKKDILTEHEIIWFEERERKIYKFLKVIEVPKEKIKKEK